MNKRGHQDVFQTVAYRPVKLVVAVVQLFQPFSDEHDHYFRRVVLVRVEQLMGDDDVQNKSKNEKRIAYIKGEWRARESYGTG